MKITRRATLAGLAGTIAAPAYINRAYANPFARFRGTTLVVNFPAHPHYDAVAKVLPQFTAAGDVQARQGRL
jgi:multiple sugar transport system substrate-binding protein